MRACMPAAAGWLCRLSSNHPAVVRDDQGLRSLTPTTISGSFSQGVGCEGGAARLHQRCLPRGEAQSARRPRQSRHVSRQDHADTTLSLAASPGTVWYPPVMAGGGQGGSTHAKLPFSKNEARAHYFNVLSIAWTHCGDFFD